MHKIIGAFFFCFIVIVIGNIVIVAQTVEGEWRADARTEDGDGIQISFSRKMYGQRNEVGQGFKFSELSGLTRERTLNGGGEVVFALRREAGTIDMTGTFSNGRGRGTFVFNADPSYVAAMKQRGFDFAKSGDRQRNRGADEWPTLERQLLLAAVLNVTTALADDLVAADFAKLEAGDLLTAAIFKVDGAFMREMKGTGFNGLTFEDLVKAKIFKIDAAFVREIASSGLADEPFENVVKMRIFKITPEFISGVRAEGFDKLDIEGLVNLRIFNIDAEFIRQARAEGVPLDVEKLVERRTGLRRK